MYCLNINYRIKNPGGNTTQFQELHSESGDDFAEVPIQG